MRVDIVKGCFQDLLKNGYSYNDAAQMTINLELVAETLFLKLGIEHPSDEHFSEVITCLSAVMQRGKEFA